MRRATQLGAADIAPARISRLPGRIDSAVTTAPGRRMAATSRPAISHSALVREALSTNDGLPDLSSKIVASAASAAAHSCAAGQLLASTPAAAFADPAPPLAASAPPSPGRAASTAPAAGLGCAEATAAAAAALLAAGVPASMQRASAAMRRSVSASAPASVDSHGDMASPRLLHRVATKQ